MNQFAWVVEERVKKFRTGQNIPMMKSLKYFRKLLKGAEILMLKKGILFNIEIRHWSLEIIIGKDE